MPTLQAPPGSTGGSCGGTEVLDAGSVVRPDDLANKGAILFPQGDGDGNKAAVQREGKADLLACRLNMMAGWGKATEEIDGQRPGEGAAGHDRDSFHQVSFLEPAFLVHLLRAGHGRRGPRRTTGSAGRRG